MENVNKAERIVEFSSFFFPWVFFFVFILIFFRVSAVLLFVGFFVCVCMSGFFCLFRFVFVFVGFLLLFFFLVSKSSFFLGRKKK